MCRGHVVCNRGSVSSYDLIRYIFRTFFGLFAEQSINAHEIDKLRLSVVSAVGAIVASASEGSKIYNEFGQFWHQTCQDLLSLFLGKLALKFPFATKDRDSD